MFSKKLFNFINKVALFAIVFASLAPTISHAIENQNLNTFSQEICNSAGKKIIIQVLTTKGQTIATVLGTQQSNNSVPTNLQHHLQHCPFCANPSIDVTIQAPHEPIVSLLAAQAEKQSAIALIVLNRFYTLPPPSQAPPNL